MELAQPIVVAHQASERLLENTLTSEDWISASLILLASLAAAIAVARFLPRLIAHGIGPGFASIVLGRLASYIVFLFGLFYALTALGVRVGPLLGALGLGGLVLALALQGVVENLVSSIVIQARRPFTIGDTVEIDGQIGIVADIDSRTTLLRSLEGSLVRLPNSKVTSSTIVNLTREPTRRSTLEVGVAYNTDLQRAREVLLAAVARVPKILAEPPPTINIAGFDQSSIGFNILYWHNSDIPSELAARTDLAIAVHQALAADDITIAFPQMVVWSGTDQPVTYGGPPAIVDIPYPGLASSESTEGSRLAAQLRRPKRRKGTANGD